MPMMTCWRGLIALCLIISGCDAGTNEQADDPIKNPLNWVIPGSLTQAYTQDMTPVDISLAHEQTGKTLRLRIPKAYLTNKQTWTGGQQGYVKIETVLPGLEPTSVALLKAKQQRAQGGEPSDELFRNRLFIYLNAKNPRPTYEENVRNRYIRKYVRIPGMVHGLEYFRRQRCDDKAERSDETADKSCRLVGDEYYMTPPEADRWVAPYCTPPELNPRGGCQTHTQYQGKRVEYIFRRSQLHRWREIDTAIRTLLDRFLVADSQALSTNNLD